MVIDTKYFYFKINEIHHLYFGVIFLIISYLFSGLFGVILTIIGVGLIIDDLYQHYRQGTDKTYRTKIHKLSIYFEPIRNYLYIRTGWSWLLKL